MPKPDFHPSADWLRETLILARRYRENRGVFATRDGKLYEEVVKPGRKYLWTSDAYAARK